MKSIDYFMIGEKNNSESKKMMMSQLRFLPQLLIHFMILIQITI